MEIKLLNDETIFLKGKKENILINPKEKELNDSKLLARVIIFTNENLGRADLKNDRVLINGPGEYEVGGVEVTKHQNVSALSRVGFRDSPSLGYRLPGELTGH